MNSKDTSSATSLQEFQAGLLPSASPAGPTISQSGPAHAPVNLSARQAKVLGLLTSATYGLPSNGSLSSADLQSSLASRLRQALDVNGSPEYALTWKEWAMMSGPPICALRASGRRTLGRDCTGWPTPRTPTGGAESAERKKALGRMESGGGDLQSVAVMAGWCSPTAQDGTRGSLPARPHDTGIPLSQQAVLSGGATPTVRDHKDGSSQSCQNVPVNKLLGREVHLAGWRTPDTMSGAPNSGSHCKNVIPGLGNQAHGVITNSPSASTENRGALNPNLPRWMMGFPASWTLCGVLAHLKLKSKPRSRLPRSPKTSPVA